MNLQRMSVRLVAVLSLVCAQSAIGQGFSSGSTGADGALNVTSGQNIAITTKPGGVYNHTTVNIAGTLRYARGSDGAPVVILATGDVTISGTLSVAGADGADIAANFNGPVVGGLGGPGGFNGGNSGFDSLTTLPTAGQGPGGAAAATTTPTITCAQGGTYGAQATLVSLNPLFGGSGGGGGLGIPGGSGASGAGGGGAILIASSTRIIVTGLIAANGGTGGRGSSNSGLVFSGPGAGGAIRLVAPEIVGTGTLQALHGSTFTCAGQAGDGRIRLEANAPIGFTGISSPVASVATAPGPVSPAGNPALVNVPTLSITSIGGLAVPTSPTASYFAPDLTLAPGLANPVPVVLAATNTPVGSPTVITVRVMPRGAATDVTVAATDHTGNFVSSTATANVTLPTGQVSAIQAFAATTLTGQTASIFPLIDGEPVASVMVAAAQGAPSTVSLITKSGREVALDALSLEDRVRVARAWQAMKSTSTE